MVVQARIRDADENDLPLLLDLESACYPPERAFDRLAYVAAFARPVAAHLLAERNGRPVAFAGAILHRGWKAANVYTLHVHPDARRRGLARALLAALEKRMREAGARRIFLEVGVRNRAAVALYRSAGYVATGRLAGYYPGGEDAWRMEKPL